MPRFIRFMDCEVVVAHPKSRMGRNNRKTLSMLSSFKGMNEKEYTT